MDLSNFDYHLSKSLIAQFPSKRREDSRLLVFHKNKGRIEHSHFYELEGFLRAGDCIVVNDSKVVRARIFGQKAKTSTLTEFLWLGHDRKGFWKGLLRGRHKIGSEFIFGEGKLRAYLASKNGDGSVLLKVDPEIDSISFLSRYGLSPLPPYIKRSRLDLPGLDLERYQTVFAREPGSVAAPTAGLHFSSSLMDRLKGHGVKFITVTLHVGLGTFQPLRQSRIESNRLHSEMYEISEESAREINEAIQNGKRVITVGTTTTRALESAAGSEGSLRAGRGTTDLFIYPHYAFKIVKNLLTNFHLPKSSLLMLVAALIGREQILKIYREAIRREYRFYSYGDAMLILADSG